MKIFNRLKALVLAQGIISRITLLPETDLILDLNYKPADIMELFRMVEREFKLTIPPEAYHQITYLEQIANYIQANYQIPNSLHNH